MARGGFGPYSLNRIETRKGTDSVNFIGLKWGYDTAAAAFADIAEVAKENNLEIGELTVIRLIDRDEADKFNR